jgi:hypothetical protein
MSEVLDLGLAVLDLPLALYEGDDRTVRAYLIDLLSALWEEREGFSGKRPFGNSGWEFDLYIPLIRAGLIPGAFDEDGFLDEVDGKAGDRLIAAAIAALGK